MARAAGGAKEALRSILSSRMVWAWATIWLATRALIVADVGFWDSASDLHLQDVGKYEVWSNFIAAEHALPNGASWQYPPGAAFLMLLPRLGPASYGETFVALMLLFDLAGLVLLALLGRRSGRCTGVWVWLLGMPLLGTFSVLRFDLVPTVIAIAALLVIHRRPGWFGALAGLGAAIKVWPVVLLFGEWDRRRLIHAGAAALAAAAVVFLLATIAFGDPSGFLNEQDGRGLQEEAVATAPWQVRELVTGHTPDRAIRYGAWEITDPAADAIAGALTWLALAVLVAAALWWRWRSREIRGGRTALAEAAVSLDFVFTLVLLLVVTSRVLSPQYMVWLLGLSAVVLTAGSARLARPAWIVVGAMALTTSTFGSAEHTLIRNLALVIATVDATIAMTSLLRAGRPPVPSAPDGPGGDLDAERAAQRDGRVARPRGPLRG